jgi:hypothetical protein
METLYDLLGALPNDDADDLRAAFRRAVKRAHPDVNPADPDAGLKLRRILHANEILSDVEQRASYDRLLEVAQLEKEQAAKRVAAAKVHKLASAVMALAGVSAVALGGYALFLQLSANTLTRATMTAEAVHEPATIGTAEEAASASVPLAQTFGHADVATSRIMPPAGSTPTHVAETAPGRVEPPIDRTPRPARKLLFAHIDHTIILYRLHKFARSFAEFAPARHLQRVSRPTASSQTNAR